MQNKPDLFSFLTRESRKKAILRSYQDPAVLPTKSDHVIVRRTEGYAAMEKRIKNQSIQLCGIQSLDVVGDIEILCGLNSYMQSLVCTTNTDVYVLDMKNFDRLVGKRNPTVLEMMKTYVESKLRTRMEQKQGHQIPLLQFLHIKLTATSLPTSKKLPPLKTTKKLPDQQFQNDHLVQCYLEGKAPLVNPHVPGALYYKELMHEKARIRENIKQRNAFNERRYLKTKNTKRAKRKPRSIMEIREALKQMMDTEVVAMNEHAARWKEEAAQAEKAIAQCEDKVRGEPDRSDKEKKKSKKDRKESKENEPQLVDVTEVSTPATKNETESRNESQAVESTTVTAPTKIGLKERLLSLKKNKPAAPQSRPPDIASKDTVVSSSLKDEGNIVSVEHFKISVDASTESEKTAQSKAPDIENKEQNSSVPNEVKDSVSTDIAKSSERTSALSVISESTEEDESTRDPGKRKMNVTENQLRGAYLLPIIEESPPDETSQSAEPKDIKDTPPVENSATTEEEEKGNALLRKLFGFGQPKTEETSEQNTLSPTSKWKIPKRFVQERINKRLKEHKIFDNPGYDDYDTNENNLNLLENRIKNFHVKYGGKAKGNIKLPKLKRFKINVSKSRLIA